jgi:hypothetical protein
MPGKISRIEVRSLPEYCSRVALSEEVGGDEVFTDRILKGDYTIRPQEALFGFQRMTISVSTCFEMFV